MTPIKDTWLEKAEYKQLPISTYQIEDDRTVKGIAAVFSNIDDGSDITHNGAFKKTISEGKDRVKHLWNHDFNQPPTAVIKELKEISVDELPIEIKTKFPGVTGGLQVVRRYLDTPRGNEILAGIVSGAINQMSYGYNAIVKDYSKSGNKTVRNLREVRLLDTSDVMWGMNAATVASKAIKFFATPKADINTEWDTKSNFENADLEALEIISAWYDSDNPNEKSAYKLQHHLPTGDHSVVWHGVRNAMRTLLGAKGAIEIPETDRLAVYNHLVEHYNEFGQVAPDFKLAQLFDSANLARQILSSDEFKEGRTFNARNLEKLQSLIGTLETTTQMLEDMLGIADTASEESAEVSEMDSTDTAKSFTNANQLIAKIEVMKRKL